ncbi:hypothetical protein EKO27_g1947 [Xylaria grammica]|uniref:Uncharacterized protein n=1 Tax=Xylaria grammica TaxID=363999 RepID=A0A439DFG1_9PEZI|nr:hypothetical protein EKO27_g1947 [Xylaria grammica]
MNNTSSCTDGATAQALAREKAINYQFAVLTSVLGVVVFFWLAASLFFIVHFYRPCTRPHATRAEDIEMSNRNSTHQEQEEGEFWAGHRS